VKGKPEYYEFNFASSGEWAVYSFGRYRDGLSLEDEGLAPSITVCRALGIVLISEAIVHLKYLPKIQPALSLRLALSAVIEDDSGSLSYWALKHPPGKPDFTIPTPSCWRSMLSMIPLILASHEVWNRSTTGRSVLRKPLFVAPRRTLLAHPASVTRDLVHSLDAPRGLRRHKVGCGHSVPARAPGRQARQYDRIAGLQRTRCTEFRFLASTAKCAVPRRQ